MLHAILLHESDFIRPILLMDLIIVILSVISFIYQKSLLMQSVQITISVALTPLH